MWEYRSELVDLLSLPMTLEFMNQLGEDRWELCGIVEFGNTRQYIFKRQRRIA